MSTNPIAGVDLEAEQVVEEESEKPVSSKKKKIRPIFVVFGAILVAEALVLFMVFGAVSGGNPDDAESGVAHADMEKPELNAASLEELGKRGFLAIGDIGNLEPNPNDPKRLFEVTLTDLKIVFDEKGWKALQGLFAKNEAAEELVKIDLQRHVRLFLSSRGGELVVRRGDTVAEDLKLYFQDLNEDEIGGLSQHIVDIGFGRVKPATR